MGSNQAAMSFLTNLVSAAFDLGASATILNSSLYTVDGGQRAVLFDLFCEVKRPYRRRHPLPNLMAPEALHLRHLHPTFSSVSGTKDL
ncbi:hypothetical protein FF2_010015 [Malus domestica]|uniref:Uncharacterized protein n=1 Tax=Malus domestica TaxID=3750 RepID=A0A498IIX3_MALDO|nr:hypothetical protein DVH24_036348 [Malus domestica]